MIKKIVFWLNSFILRLKRKRILTFKENVVKVNVGSGFNVTPGWINIDGNFNLIFRKLPKSLLKLIYKYTDVKKWFEQEYFVNTLSNNFFIHHNIEYGLPFRSETVDFIYSSHLLEHLFKDDAEFLINEMYRVLKKGGILRIVVPDLEYVVELYKKSKKEEALEYFFPNSKADYFSRHRYMYDFDLLAILMQKIGFHSIKKWEFRKGELPDVHLLDNRPTDSLHIEARK